MKLKTKNWIDKMANKKQKAFEKSITLLFIAFLLLPLASALTLTKMPKIWGINFLYILIAIFVLSVLYLVMFILTIKSIIISGNENKWKFKWVLIVVFLNVLGILLYLIFGKRKKIPESKQAEKTRDKLLEEAPEKTLDKETKAIISFQETVQPTIAEKKTEGIPAELKPAVDYIKETRAKGFDDEHIKDALRNSGWDDEQIRKAFEFLK